MQLPPGARLDRELGVRNRTEAVQRAATLLAA